MRFVKRTIIYNWAMGPFGRYAETWVDFPPAELASVLALLTLTNEIEECGTVAIKTTLRVEGPRIQRLVADIQV